MITHSNNGHSNGTGTKENIRSIEQTLERLDRRLDEIDKKFSSAGRVNWQIILSGVGVAIIVVGGLWGLTVLPINAEVGRLDRGLSKIYEVAGVQGITLAENGKETVHINDEIVRLRGHIQKVADEHVPNKEFSVALGATIGTRVELQRQVDALIKKVDDVFPPQKTLEDLTRRLAELERTRNTVVNVPPLK